ncbi:MAG: transporter substrate-binding domain-containing protein [Synergistaceae bacterium]|nr:transporter substrate-binding domain-containing protein [Synergistaceae bacterium]
MKKVLCALMLVLVFTAAASARHKVGVVERLNVTPENFREMTHTIEKGNIVIVANTTERPEFTFYSSMNQMIMALNAGEIDEVLFPEAQAEYFLSLNPDHVIKCMVMMKDAPFLLSFGFSAENKDLCESFSRALAEMKRDGTLVTLYGKYILGANTAVFEESAIADPSRMSQAPVVFRKFDGAREIRIAVTGDMPPIDYIAPDGSAQGFNAAILAEICGRLGLNVKLQNIESGARVAMLTSGRSDAVFWFEHKRGAKDSHDAPEGVILSEPYFQFDTFCHIGRR